MGVGTKVEAKIKEWESSSTVDRMNASSFKNSHFKNGVSSLLSKKKSHPEVQFRNRAVKYTHVLDGLSQLSLVTLKFG